MALNWARTPLNNVISQPIPLLIELRTYIRDSEALLRSADRTSGQCKDFLEFFHNGNVICRLNQHQLHEQLKAGKVLVMFDGLDEVFDPAQRDEVITDIHRFTNDYPNVRVIVTSRIIGYKPQRLRDAQFRHFMLQDLESDQIQDFIYRWHELTFTDEADKVRKRERLQQAIKTSSAIGELAGNPLLLTMMAILNRNQELPRDRPELYNQASRVLLHQWDVEQKLLENPRVDSVAIDYKDKQAMLRQVAHHMQAADKGLAGNLIRGDDLERIVTGYLKSIEVSQARTVARLLIEQLRSRNFILCFLGADSYGFVHRTFLEYFCACKFVERFGKRGLEGGLTLDELKREVFGKHWQDESWHEVLRLIVGMIDTSFAGEIIDYLMAFDGEEEKFINLLLAAECILEVRSRRVIQRTDIRLYNKLRELYENLKNQMDLIDSNRILSKREEYDFLDKICTKVVSAVASTWNDDSDTLLWLKTCIQSNKGIYTRATAVRELARGWKNEPGTLHWLKTYAQEPNISWWLVQQTVVQEIARGWKDDPETLHWLKTWVQADGNKYDRFTQSAAVQELVRGWKDDPETLSMLKTFIQSDERSDVARLTALEELVRGWKNDLESLSMLKAHAQSDKDGLVRDGALEELAEGWKDDPDVLPILKSRIQSDDEWRVRSTALEKLARHWKNDPETLPILKTRTLSDDHWQVRYAAVRELARGWKDEPWMFEFLCNCALNDPFERKKDRETNPRQLALEIIIKQYRDHPQTLPLLQDRAENDPDEKVREFAKNKLYLLRVTYFGIPLKAKTPFAKHLM
jgi:predicted NACHT family NTPase